MRPVEPLEHRVRGRLADLEANGLLRVLRSPAGIDLCSNDYLGLAAHPILKERMADAVKDEGCGSTGSRLLRGERASFAAVEQRFAQFKGTEKSLYFATGYMANIAVLTTFPETEDVLFSDERNHASLIDGLRLSRGRRVVFPHTDVEALERLMKEAVGGGQKFLVTESLFSMDGDLAPLERYATLCRTYRVAMIVDEAHAVGIYGTRGSGAIEAAAVEDDVFVSINTAGKALGVSGAFVTGPTWAIDYLVQRARPFIFSTAPAPSLTAALDASLTLIMAEPERRERLRMRSTFLRARLAEQGVSVASGPSDSHIVPVIIGEVQKAVAIAAALQDEGFDVRAIRPPTVPIGTARLRLSVNVGLSESTLDRFVGALATSLRESVTCSTAFS